VIVNAPEGSPRTSCFPVSCFCCEKGPAHGYDLVNRLVPFGFSSDPPVVYRNLRRMESDRLVESSWDTSGKGPARRVYELTDRGISHLESWTIAIKYQRDVLNTFLNRHEDDIVGQTPSSASHERRAIPAGS